MRAACPSCSTKRSILFGEKIRELVKPISHVHVTFTIPKILRAWFRRNRNLLKRMVQSANWAIRIYFIESLGIADGCTGGIYCRARLLKVLLDEGIISQQMVDLLLGWNHNSGFNVHARGRIRGTDRKAIENVARWNRTEVKRSRSFMKIYPMAVQRSA